MRNYVYTLEHRGEKFRMHGITRVIVNSAFSCNVCKKQFALDAVVALLNYYLDNHSLCRDLACCQWVGTPGLTANLPVAVESNMQRAASELKSTSVPEWDDPNAEPAEKAVCRWCKGKREITVNFKTKPCDCVKGDGTVGKEDVGVGWTVKKALDTSA